MTKQPNKPTIYRKRFYYPTYDAAQMALSHLAQSFPAARIVEYTRGWAIQREKNGPYFGEGASFGTTAWS